MSRREWHGPPRGRPPWWPEGEPFPPVGRPPWMAMRRRFFRRFALLLVLLLVLLVAVSVVVTWLVAAALGFIQPSPEGGPWWVGRGPPWPIGFFVIVAILVLVARAARGVASPVGRLVEAAGRVESGDFQARVPERGPSEVRSLARAFNTMTSRLERNEAQRRALLADVTHELRSPLTIVQGQLEGILDGLYPADPEHLAPILDETRVLARLIEDLRTLAQAEAGALSLHREPTDVRAVARDVAAAYADPAQRAGVALAVAPGDAPPADADPIRVREVLANLVANALRYTPRGGRIGIDVRRAGASVETVVADTGSGIAPEALPHVFDRFSKSIDSPGAGLGLAIARTLVVAHGGLIRAESPPEGGTRIAFTLPLAR